MREIEGIYTGPNDDEFERRQDILEKLSSPRKSGTLYIYDEATELMKRAQSLSRESSIGVGEATWVPEAQFPDVPVAILLATDIHYGALGTDYGLLDKHLEIVENTPNFFMVVNGDSVDNFNVAKHPSGMYENPLPPQLQTQAMMEKFRALDEIGKIGVLSFGNHDNFMGVAGYDWLESFARGMKASIFTSGGFLHIMHGQEHYGMAMTHQYWGVSKLNPTNAAKRFWEHEYPQADIVFLGHTHQSEALHWERGGKQRIAVIGGSYKSQDNWATKLGIGRNPGKPGITLLLYPNEHRMEVVKNIETAQEFLLRQQ